jgi:ribosome biogenesis GTPase
LHEGTVFKVSREFAWVKLDCPAQSDYSKDLILAKPSGKLDFSRIEQERLARELRRPEELTAQHLVIGDRVLVSAPPGGGQNALWVIDSILERETWLLRRSDGRYARRSQLVVANADTLAVVVAPNPTIRLGTIDRYFLAAMQGGLSPLLIVNKIDLDKHLQQNPGLLFYRQLGYEVVFVSALHSQGTCQLPALLKGRITVFCGHSGVGKSTILSFLTGKVIKTGSVRERDQKGRQTTVLAEAYDLPDGGIVVDTPGVREFGLAHMDWLDVNEYFNDISEIAVSCSYSNCSHKSESGCAVIRAVEDGTIFPERIQSYRRLRAEVEASLRSK